MNFSSLKKGMWASAAKEKIDKLYYIKVSTFCASKDAINKVERQLTEWENIFASHISDDGLVSRIYKENWQLNNTKTTQLKNGHRNWMARQKNKWPIST